MSKEPITGSLCWSSHYFLDLVEQLAPQNLVTYSSVYLWNKNTASVHLIVSTVVMKVSDEADKIKTGGEVHLTNFMDTWIVILFETKAYLNHKCQTSSLLQDPLRKVHLHTFRNEGGKSLPLKHLNIVQKVHISCYVAALYPIMTEQKQDFRHLFLQISSSQKLKQKYQTLCLTLHIELRCLSFLLILFEMFLHLD